MSYTDQYLQSEMAAQGLEVSVLVNCLVQDATQLAASDLHIEPWEDAISVRARVNGVLIEVAHLPLDLMDKILRDYTVFKDQAEQELIANLETLGATKTSDAADVTGLTVKIAKAFMNRSK